MRKAFLNLGGGNKPMVGLGSDSLEVVIDQGLDDNVYNRNYIADYLSGLIENPVKRIIINEDIFDFMSTTSLEFDGLMCNRVLEHVGFESVGYFQFLMYRVLKPGTEATIIVPNAEKLLKMYLTLDVNDPDYYDKKMLITTEICNTRDDPHLSLWRPDEVRKHFIDINDDYWELKDLIPEYKYEGRDIYMKFDLIRK